MNHPPPDIDLGRLARIGAFDDPAIAEIIERFLDTLDERIAAMASARAEEDYGSLVRLAHELRGSAANCGFAEIAHFCNAMDDAPDSFDLPTFEALANKARLAWERSRRI